MSVICAVLYAVTAALYGVSYAQDGRAFNLIIAVIWAIGCCFWIFMAIERRR